MMILLSCAKTMCDTTGIKAPALTTPKFGKEASDIILQLTEYSPDELKRMLHTTSRLAMENYERYRLFHSEETPTLLCLHIRESYSKISIRETLLVKNFYMHKNIYESRLFVTDYYAR